VSFWTPPPRGVLGVLSNEPLGPALFLVPLLLFLFICQIWSQETPPPGRVSYLLCSLIKSPEEEDPLEAPGTIFFEGNPLLPGSWLGNIFFFCWCFADTQITRQLHQERTQVVCGSKEAQKRLARIEQHSRNWHVEPIMYIGIVVCTCSRHALVFKMLLFRSVVRATAWPFHVRASQKYCMTNSHRSRWTVDYNANVLCETQSEHGGRYKRGHTWDRRSVSQYFAWYLFRHNKGLAKSQQTE